MVAEMESAQRPVDLSSVGLPAAIPAAEYVRMSTEHQQYSTDNQHKVIAEAATGSSFREWQPTFPILA
jgi:hypothetical protein